MTIKLRPYQAKGINDIRESIKAGHRSTLYVLPTGGGKTMVSAYMAHGTISKRKRFMFLVHRKELVIQSAKTMAAWGLSYGIITPTVTQTNHPLQIASIGTLANRIKRLPVPDVVFVDEAHHVNAATHSGVLRYYAEHGSIIVGLTATPQRLDGQGLGEHFTNMVQGPSSAELMEAGYLSQYRLYGPKEAVDLSELRTRAGDYATDDLEKLMDKPKIIGDAVEHYADLAMGKRAIVFCVSIKHSMHTAESFTAAGIKAEHIDGSLADQERASIITRFASGQTQVLCNVGIVSEGFDVPACKCVIMLRPTKSLTLHLQALGRGLRPTEDGEPAIILDHVQNFLTHGMPDDEREWSLEGRKRKCRKGEIVEVVNCHQCKGCYRVYELPNAACPYCGMARAGEGRVVEQEDGKLIEISRAKRATREEIKAARTIEALHALAVKYGYSPNWAQQQMEMRKAYAVKKRSEWVAKKMQHQAEYYRR